MNEDELTSLVDSVLGYQCSCRRGGSCQPFNHTWRRNDGKSSHSRLFVAKTGPNPQGVIALNIPKNVEAQFVAEAANLQVDSRLDDYRSPVFSRYVLHPRPGHEAFVAAWVERTVN